MVTLDLKYREGSSDILLNSSDSLKITELSGIARYILRGDSPVIPLISAELGLTLNSPINRATVAEMCSALHLGPDEWLLLFNQTDTKNLDTRVRNAAGSYPFALVDVSHRNVGFRFHGEQVVDALCSGCPQNLEIDFFPIGKCTRTVYAKVEICLWRRDEYDFVLETSRSSVPYLLGYLAQETSPITGNSQTFNDL
tara:strand:- start:820 stop:1410 length:591 start_codon:yes stop_codon:yes gene_type:complete